MKTDYVLIAFILTQGGLFLGTAFILMKAIQCIENLEVEFKDFHTRLLEKGRRKTDKPLVVRTEADIFDDIKFLTDEQIAELQEQEYRKRGYSEDQIEKAMGGEL
jgi:hypothetical protein